MHCSMVRVFGVPPKPNQYMYSHSRNVSNHILWIFLVVLLSSRSASLKMKLFDFRDYASCQALQDLNQHKILISDFGSVRCYRRVK